MDIITKDAWKRRYAAHMAKVADVSEEIGLQAADASLEAGSAEEFATPEEAADAEISCWADSEGATCD
ncbi:hypothetical protein [Piscinibacter gummiphilus]|uniref:Conjugal transfer protein TraD n=1 Tax=Piscinibacter gummiphilus TaxID=946333 RepID=A0ABZ0CNK6_9BURK|nr:hypothetical protein [Piscinibacter gummiphilus]WOB06558.1 hypothetical protein RXV79_16690 [Piscinibacter gummiphilus]